MKNKLSPSKKLPIYYAIAVFILIGIISILKAGPHYQVLSQTSESLAATVAPPIQIEKEFLSTQVFNEDDKSYTGESSPVKTAWIGNGTSRTKSYLGLQFKNVQLPVNATIKEAHIDVITAAKSTRAVNVSIATEKQATPAAFTSKNPPSKRILTGAKTIFTDTSIWELDSIHSLNSLADQIKEVAQLGSSQTINIIAKGIDKENNRKTIYGNSVSLKIPKLIINYEIPAPTPMPTPIATPTLPPATPTPTASPSPTVQPIPVKKLRVLEIRYFPPGITPIYQPNILSAQLQTLIQDASSYHKFKDATAQPTIQVEVVKVIDRQKARPNPDGTWQSSYAQILAEDNICDQISSLNIDNLWVWVDPRTNVDTAPGLEYVISSKYFQDQDKIQAATYATPMFCNGQKDFVFFQFDDSRTADLALHSFGHFMEGLLSNLFTQDLFWSKFSGSTYADRTNRCGNVHFPPNGTADYDYGNTTQVTSSCEDWHPDGSGATQTFNCTKWNCSQEGYLKWWMQNMPNYNNPLTYLGKKLPNWWEFVTNIDATITQYNNDPTYYIDRLFLSTVPNAAIPEINMISKTTQNSGIQATWMHENTGANTLLVVSAAYRAHNNPSATINTLTYNGLPLTKIRTDKHSDRASEMWYLLNPPQGKYLIDAQFTADPESQFFTATTITNVNQATPIAMSAGAGDNTFSPGTLNTASISIPSALNQIVFGVLSTYPDGANNQITAQPGTERIWKGTTNSMEIESNGGARYSQEVTTTLQWTSTSQFSWSASAIAINKAQ